MNDDKVRLRKCEDDLYVCGIGVIVMGVWNIIKVIMGFVLNSREVFAFEAEDKFALFLAIVIVCVVLAIILIVFLKLHLYVGLNAIKAAKRQEYKKGYIPWTVVLLILMVLSLSTYYLAFQDLDNIDTTIASLLVDLTTIYIFVSVIVSTGKIRKLKNNLAAEG